MLLLDNSMQQWIRGVIHTSFFFFPPRKSILRFLDAERDVSVVKSSFKPGDVIHYVLDRRRTLNISQDLHSLLPEVSPMKNRRFKTCAVVGNSGILLDSGCGKEIDTHDFVIRWVFFCFWTCDLLCFLDKSWEKCFNFSTVFRGCLKLQNN